MSRFFNRLAHNALIVGDSIARLVRDAWQDLTRREEPYVLRVAEYTRTPGPHFRADGPHSGEWLHSEVIGPIFREVVTRDDRKLVIDLDGTAGYGYGFMLGAFGPFRKYNQRKLRKYLSFKCADEPYLIEEIWFVIEGEEES